MKSTKISIEVTPDEFRAINAVRKASAVSLMLLGTDLGILQGLVDKVYHAVRAKLPAAERGINERSTF